MAATLTKVFVRHCGTNKTPAVLTHRATLTALAGSIVYFILPQLIESPYDLPTISVSPDTLSSVTVVSTASGVTYYAGWPMDQAMLDALGGVGENPAVFTLMDQTYMGAGSGELTTNIVHGILASKNSDVADIYKRGAEGRVLRSIDGANAAFGAVVASTDRGEVQRRIVQTKSDGTTKFRAGHQRVGIDASIVWGSWATFDGSMNPATLLKMFYGATTPNYKQLVALSNKSLSDADIAKVFNYAN